MDGPAAIAVVKIWEALSKLESTQTQIIGSKSNVTDIGIHVNTATTATTDSIGAQLQAISELNDAIQAAQAALVGSADTDASVSLVWLNQVQLTLEQDSQQLAQIKGSLATLYSRTSEIVKNLEDSLKHITSSANALRAKISRLG